MRGKKLISSLLVIAMLITMLPANALASSGLEGQKNVATDGRVVEINETNFPSKVFRDYILENFDTEKDNVLVESEIAAVKKIDLSGKSVEDLTGIENFTNLNTLDCDNCGLKTVNLEGLDNLSIVDLSGNNLMFVNSPAYVIAKDNVSYVDTNEVTPPVGFDSDRRVGSITGGKFDGEKFIFDEGSNEIRYYYKVSSSQDFKFVIKKNRRNSRTCRT